MDNTLIYEAEAFLDKNKIRKVYIVGAVLFLLSVGCILWAIANWDAYTEVRYSLKYGTNVETGLASILYGWGWAFAITIPIIYGLMWFSFDFKNPSFAVNKDGVFINRELFKHTFLHWDEFEKIEKQTNGTIWMYFKNPEKIISQQPRFYKPFLKQTYLKDKSPMAIENDEDFAPIAALIEKYGIK